MTTVIYVDKLLAVNLLISVILLLSASRLCGIHIKRKGLIFGTLISTLSSLLIFLPWENIFLLIAIKIITVMAIVYFTFFPQTLKSLLKSLGAFIAVNCIFAGIMLFVKFFIGQSGLFYINGTVYFDFSALLLILMFVFCYGALCLGEYLTKKRTKSTDKFEIEVSYRGKAIKTEALLDSGSSLKDSFSGRPVIVAELKSIAGLLLPYELPYFKGDYLNANVPETLKTSARLIPYKALGNNGLLPSFKVDCVTFIYGGKKYVSHGVYVGVITDELSSGEYRAIANKMLFEC